MYKCILFVGAGQIGKATLKMILEKNPKKIIIHNLTKKESDDIVNQYSSKYKNIEFISSHGNIFMPYYLKDLNNKDLYKKSKEIIEYFYSEITEEKLEKSTIGTLTSIYKPDLIIDAINSATVLGNSYDPEYKKECYEKNAADCCEKLMVDDYITKIINFVYSLQYSIEKFNIKKYIKVSTTGLGGMGINMPYTHGDNPKIQLSSALMGKISASGILHQLLWNLSHTKGMNISLVIPSTFVGYDSVLNEIVETDKGLLQKRSVPILEEIKFNKELTYNNVVTDEYLKFPVVRAGENHVYSKLELEVLTAIGQMEAITKEEVANKVIDCIYGNSTNDIITALDRSMLGPTYSGREMIYEIKEKINKLDSSMPGIATGNLGIRLSKQLYELSLIKNCFPTIDELSCTDDNEIIEAVKLSLNEQVISEIITLGMPILLDDNQIYIGDYTLIPTSKEDKIVTLDKIEQWSKIGWVDLRKENIIEWKKTLIEIYKDAKIETEKHDCSIDKQFRKITNDYDIAEYLAYYNNIKNKGRKK